MARNLSANGPTKDDNKFSGAIDGEALKQYTGRVRHLMTMQKELAECIRETCAEADEKGICSKSELRRIARLSLVDQETLEAKREREDMLLHALGDFASLPLGEAALSEAERAEPPWEDSPIGSAH